MSLFGPVMVEVAQSVHSGFSGTLMAAASLFGLLLVALTFGYRAAMDRIEDPHDFRQFGSWIWSSGLTCCVYYAFCLVIPAHLLVTNYSQSRLVIWVVACTAIILAGHIIETRALYRMAKDDWSSFKRVFWAQTATAAVVFVCFLALNLSAITRSTRLARYDDLLVALALTLVLISIRAVLLVATSFYAVTLLYTYEKGK